MYEQVNIGELVNLLRQAGKAILEIYDQHFDVELKPDLTPITLADQNSNNIITQGLNSQYADIPIISEENAPVAFNTRKDWAYFWLLDPLDGTKEFIKKNGEFAINLALVERKQPVMGLIYVPVIDTIYYAVTGQGCYKVTGRSEPISIHANIINSQNKVTVVASRSHVSREVYTFAKKLGREFSKVELIQHGSAIKFGMIAEGKADFYLRTGRTMEWDTAAGQVIVTESGKRVYEYKTGQPLEYNKENLSNPWFIVK
jgi:3'(2'), 5'-bisphosphate nucleotidase